MLGIFKKIRGYALSKSIKFGFYELYRFSYYRLIRNSYGLQGEDLIIDHLVGHKKKGFYVDVGASDPTRFSNTNRFYKRGWRGINIDPNPSSIEKFLKQRARDINVNCGVGEESDEPIDFFVMFPPTVSTFSKKFRDFNLEMGCYHESTIKVECKSLESILDEHLPKEQEIDFMTIDAEGLDFKVLKGNNWEKYKPKVICIECPTHLNKMNRHCEILDQQKYLADKGYQMVYCNGMDCFYLYTKDIEERLTRVT